MKAVRLTTPAGIAVGLGLALPSCSESAPRWIPLAPLVELDASSRRRQHPLSDGRVLEIEGEGEGEEGAVTLNVPFRRADWTRAAGFKLWHAPYSLRAPTRATWLTTPEGDVPWSEEPHPRKDERSFTFKKDQLVLSGFEDEPPAEATLRYEIRRPADLEPGRVQLMRTSAAGIHLLPGERAVCRSSLPARSVLRFGIVRERLVEEAQDEGENVFRVSVNGAPAFEGRLGPSGAATCAWQRVELPADGLEQAELVFAVDGALASTAFVDPCIGPAEIGTPERRPWPDGRPDLVLFVADTFRADNLALHGGTLGITPRLDQLARQSVAFRRAWSTSTWTLPAHASMLTGYYPLQVLGAPGDRRLPRAADTVAERLARAGYRTGAITAGAYVSSRFGLEQGFDYFCEHDFSESLAHLLAEARAHLAADDGRPTFLLVHTYRTHWRYQPSARARGELSARLDIRGESGALLEAIHARDEVRSAPESRTLPRTPEVSALIDQLEAHYRGGVFDLDHELGDFLDELEARGLFDRGYFVFTSDHGESFGEHDTLFHFSAPFEELARVPLLIRGRGLAPRVVEEPVSLVDLAPTLMELAGLAPDRDWPGRSLLVSGRGGPERVLFAFEHSAEPEDSVFVLAGEQKVFLTGSAGRWDRLSHAFDLAGDPAEQHDLAATEAAWPAALREHATAQLARALRPLYAEEPAETDAAKAAELRALGY